MEKNWPPLEECPQYIYGMINGYLDKFEWEDQEFGDDKYYYYSSDEDDEFRYEYDPNVLKKFVQQVRRSRGYEVDCHPPRFLRSPFDICSLSDLEEGKPLHEPLNIAMDLVLKDVRSKTGKPYQLEEVLKLVDTKHRIFLITFTAKEAVPESTLETFLAAVFAPSGGPEEYEVLECFLKPDYDAPTFYQTQLSSCRQREDDNDISKKKTQKKVETIDSFLQSLGLEKYSNICHAKEVDMTALKRMCDRDLFNVLRIPMVPRTKILRALHDRVTRDCDSSPKDQDTSGTS